MGDKSSDFYPDEHSTRVGDGNSYIYEELLQTEGTDVKVRTWLGLGLGLGLGLAYSGPMVYTCTRSAHAVHTQCTCSAHAYAAYR